MGVARGNVASGEGALGSAEKSATNPRRTHTLVDPTPRSPLNHPPKDQEQHAYGRVNVAARKTKRIVPLGKTAKGGKGMVQLPVDRQTLLKINWDDLTTNHSSNFPPSKTTKGAKGMRQLPVTSQTLLQSNGDNLITKHSNNVPPRKTAKGAKGIATPCGQ